MVASIPRAVATKRGVSAALMVNMAARSGSTPTDLSNLRTKATLSSAWKLPTRWWHCPSRQPAT